MKFATALVGAGALCASTDAFVPVAMPAGGSFVSHSSPLASSVTAVPGRGGDVSMSLSGGGSKRGGAPKGMSSKITNIFRGVNRKG